MSKHKNKLRGILSSEGQLKARLTDNELQIKVSVTESGARGLQGEEGKSAYEVWLEDGNRGDITDFLESLKSKHIDTYIHKQKSSSDTWIIEHDLNKHPSVTIVDSANSVVVGNIEYIDKTKLEVTFVGAFSGQAYLN